MICASFDLSPFLTCFEQSKYVYAPPPPPPPAKSRGSSSSSSSNDNNNDDAPATTTTTAITNNNEKSYSSSSNNNNTTTKRATAATTIATKITTKIATAATRLSSMAAERFPPQNSSSEATSWTVKDPVIRGELVRAERGGYREDLLEEEGRLQGGLVRGRGEVTGRTC